MSLQPLFCISLSGNFRQVLLYYIVESVSVKHFSPNLMLIYMFLNKGHNSVIFFKNSFKGLSGDNLLSAYQSK